MPLLKSKTTDAAAVPTGVRTAKTPAKLRGRMPSKTTINFAEIGVKHTRWGLVILSLVLILAVAAAIGKFLVYDRLEAVSTAQAEAAEVHRQVVDCNARIQSYGELNDLYAHYTYSGLTVEERNRVDRLAAMELLERVVFPRTEVASWTLNGNCLTLTIEGKTLQEINLTVQKLLEDDLVSYCEVNNAGTQVKIARNGLKIGEEVVSSNIVIYLTNPKEVEGK